MIRNVRSCTGGTVPSGRTPQAGRRLKHLNELA